MDDIFKQKLEELRAKLPIDKFNLDEECRNQAVLYDEVGDLRTKTRDEFHRAENKLNFVKSDLYMKIRHDPAKYGIDKITEASLEAAINLQPEFIEAQEDLIDAGGLSDSFGNLLNAVEQRKSMLKELVSLFLVQYYHEKQDKDLVKTAQKMNEGTEEEITKLRNKRFEDNKVESVTE